MIPGGKIKNSTVEFFVNPPEGTDDSLNRSNQKSDNNFALKTFEK